MLYIQLNIMKLTKMTGGMLVHAVVHPAKKIISHMKYEAWAKRPFFLNSIVGKLTFGRQARLWYGIWSLHFETESSATVCKVVRITKIY